MFRIKGYKNTGITNRTTESDQKIWIRISYWSQNFGFSFFYQISCSDQNKQSLQDLLLKADEIPIIIEK